jgi:hypothetical protein
VARSAFERRIELNLAQFSQEAARKKLIETARQGLAAFLARQSEKPAYTILVDGHPASSEDEVRYGGVISYRFLRMPQIGRYAITIARQLSPVASGHYRSAWFLLADNTQVAENAIPPKVGELLLINDVPYARKIQTRGARILGVPPGIVERVRQFVQRQFGGQVVATLQYVTLKGGYQLKRPPRRRRSLHELTYPALSMKPRV